MSETEVDAALSGEIRREMNNFPLALQRNILYEELKGNIPVNMAQKTCLLSTELLLCKFIYLFTF